jgi:hypothetical protein
VCAGRHALPLQEARHEVVGLDASPWSGRRATRRGVNAVIGSVERIPSGLDLFDTLLGNNLGLLASAERAAVVQPGLVLSARTGSGSGFVVR